MARAVFLTSLCLLALSTLAAPNRDEWVAISQMKGINAEIMNLQQKANRIEDKFQKTLNFVNGVSKEVSREMQSQEVRLRDAEAKLDRLDHLEPRLEENLEKKLEVRLKKMLEEQAGEG